MIRRWQASATRARRYAASGHRRIASRRRPLRLEWLRRRRAASSGARIVLHTRVSLGVSLHMHSRHMHSPAPLMRAPARARATLGRGREVLRHEWMPAPAGPLPATPPAPVARVRAKRIMRVRSRTHLSTVLLRERFTDRVLSRSMLATAAPPGRPQGDRVTAAHSLPQAVARLATPVATPALREHAGRVHRSQVTRTAIGSIAMRPRRMPASRDDGITARQTGIAPLRLEVAEHREESRRHATPLRAFAAQQQPLAAAPARTAPVETAPVERIERTLRESLTVVAERTVQRELARALRTGAPTTRRLRESIQSEMYDDIVFERERRGDR